MTINKIIKNKKMEYKHEWMVKRNKKNKSDFN